jgi:hypothetical protein
MYSTHVFLHIAAVDVVVMVVLDAVVVVDTAKSKLRFVTAVGIVTRTTGRPA